ncbi:MAG: tripartite tricarboxylate transporter permease, partial [Candidatus Nanoarchaeia archaeon]
MILELLLALLLGVCAGSITGLTPGIHTNTVAALVLAGLPFLSAHFSFTALGVFLVTMVIVHSFLDFIPSIFLGAPDEGETALSVLPGHKLLLEGQGYKALKLTVVGGVGTFLIGLVTLPLFFALVKYGYSYLSVVIAPIIVVFSA